MPNSFFQFKQFTVFQDRCAMKVSTDACLQAAWFADFLENKNVHQVLDIGAGTGLLTLMLAQKLHGARFTSIEIEEEAFMQAAQNVAASPWSGNIDLQHTAVQDLAASQQFDAIISNPPFFKNHLKTTELARRKARHDDFLPKSALASAAYRLLSNEGFCCVMYPVAEWTEWLQTAAQSGLQPVRILKVYPNLQKSENRMIGIFVKQKNLTCLEESITIYQALGQYTADFTRLLQDYYINF